MNKLLLTLLSVTCVPAWSMEPSRQIVVQVIFASQKELLKLYLHKDRGDRDPWPIIFCGGPQNTCTLDLPIERYGFIIHDLERDQDFYHTFVRLTAHCGAPRHPICLYSGDFKARVYQDEQQKIFMCVTEAGGVFKVEDPTMR